MNKLNNRYSQKQLQPFKIQDKETTDDKKLANCFNAHFSNADKLTTVYQFFSMHHKNDNFDLKINSQELPKSESKKYLGVHMDNEPSWKNHMEHTINKVNQSLRLIQQLTGATWESTQDTMNTTYKTYIKPVMKYRSEVLVTASNSTLKALETAQNNALKLITRGVKTTPILALQLCTGHLPMTCEIKQQAAVFLTKIKALNRPLGQLRH